MFLRRTHLAAHASLRRTHLRRTHLCDARITAPPDQLSAPMMRKFEKRIPLLQEMHYRWLPHRRLASQ
jgi:hypothetical protein